MSLDTFSASYLRTTFGERVSLDPDDPRYDAAVMPQNETELVELAEWSVLNGCTLVPRAKATAMVGLPPSVPRPGRRVAVDLTAMRGIISLDLEHTRVAVAPGIHWGELERALAREGLQVASSPMVPTDLTVAEVLGEELEQNEPWLLGLRMVSVDGSVCDVDCTGRASWSAYAASPGFISEYVLRIEPLPVQ